MPPRSSINTFYTVSLDVNDHLHVPVARSAEVVADRHVPSGRFGRDRDDRLVIRREIEIDLQILLIEAVIAVESRYMQRHRLAEFHRDLVRREFESFRSDRNLARRGVLPGSQRCSEDKKDESGESFHSKTPGFAICWTPSVPPNSRRVSSTSSMESW